MLAKSVSADVLPPSASSSGIVPGRSEEPHADKQKLATVEKQATTKVFLGVDHRQTTNTSAAMIIVNLYVIYRFSWSHELAMS